jgi:hypothetical protein
MAFGAANSRHAYAIRLFVGFPFFEIPLSIGSSVIVAALITRRRKLDSKWRLAFTMAQPHQTR